MSGICHITPGFLLSYVNVFSKTEVDPEEIFKRLSLEMGGDGKTITKDQLDDYIDNAESGNISITKEKLSALKRIQSNWDTIANGDDELTYEEMGKYKILLFATLGGGFEVSEDATDVKLDVYKLLKEDLGMKNLDDASNSELNSYLNTLLSKESDDEAIGDAIDSLINLMAERNESSNVNVEA